MKRLIQAVITWLTVVSLAFVLIRMMPGGPMDYARAQIRQNNPGLSSQELQTLVEAYASVAPDQPLWKQYVDYIWGILHFDFGKSFWYNEPVGSLIADGLPWTVFYGSISLVLAFFIAIALGSLLAYFEGSKFDVAISSLAVTLNSIPYYIAAIVLLVGFAYIVPIFPTGGRMDPNTEPGLSLAFFLGALHHAALPIISLVITGWGGQALSMRGNSISVLGDDFLRVARLRGLSSRRIAFRYVARNAILPLWTGLMISFGFIFGGSIILEEIFRYPGLGLYVFKSIGARDYPLMMGGFLMLTFTVIVGVFIADLTYGFLDPRASTGGENSESY